jgi:hypothetical protein
MASWTMLRSARRSGVAVAFAMLAACGGEGGAGEEAKGPPLPAGVSAVAGDARIAMPAGQDPACQPASIRKVFRAAPEWNGYWEFGLPAHCPRPQLPAGFDWSREMVVFVTMGRRDSPADSIMVQGVGAVNDSVMVVVRRTTRATRCDEPQVRTWPGDLVRVPATQGPAKFAEQHVKLPCPGA